MRPFVDRYPPFMRKSPEFRDLQQALEPELLALWEARDSALEQLCADTVGWGLPYWERTLGLPVEPGKSPEVRRSRIKARLLGADVTTVELLRKLAEAFAGGAVSVIEYPERFWVELGFPGVNGVPPNLKELADSLRELMPAHLGWGLAFFFELEAALTAAAHTELCGTLEVWPQVVNELESAGALRGGGVVEYHRALEVRPMEMREETV